MGSPHADTWPIYHRYFGTRSEEELRLKLGDDLRWLGVWEYKEPRGFFPIPHKVSHGDPGPLAECTDIKRVEGYDWPKPRLVNFEPALQRLRDAGPFYRASGLWTCFYHDIMDLFGMEYYMTAMYEYPKVVQAVTDRVCQFYYDANELFFTQAGDLADAFFFGNDFGTQLDTICSPAHFDEFVMPWFRRFTEQAHRHGRQAILHSCGSIHRMLPRLIDANVNCLHPLQAKARNMDADTLARDFKGKIAFLGGVDTQDLLVNGTPQQVKEDVRRIKKLLGPCLIVSPSHEALLPNVPPQNVAAMAEAALEG
ncbi:MAG TPA: uroporphyrinogen decarboxylase family protein [Tepidisphaeraceae bacterium]|jgi:uroporphyrinogen decarboxylase